jgi:hypothetical protein
LLWIFFSCAKVAPPKPVVLPPTKTIRPDLVEETIFSRGYMSGYEIWEFLRINPSEKDVIGTFGLPDSVWLDDLELTKFMYYFITEIQDYNIIEINAKTDSVSGFEWD